MKVHSQGKNPKAEGAVWVENVTIIELEQVL